MFDWRGCGEGVMFGAVAVARASSFAGVRVEWFAGSSTRRRHLRCQSGHRIPV